MAIRYLLPKRPQWFQPMEGRGGALGAVDSWASLGLAGGRGQLGSRCRFRGGRGLKGSRDLCRLQNFPSHPPPPSHSWLLQEPDDLVTMLRNC